MITTDGWCLWIWWVMRSTLVSARTRRDLDREPRREARRAVCRADSSLVTYSTEPADSGFASALATCRSSVDLPMPGSPPTRTADPGTTPPPRMRSNSPMPEGMRGESAWSIASSGSGSAPCARSAVAVSAPAVIAAAGARDAARGSGVGSLYSCSASHVPQSGHLPIHLGWTEPQELQRKCVFVLAMRVREL